MTYLKRIVWLLPVLGLLYMYLNQGLGFAFGSTEHYDLLASLGYSADVTLWLTWLSFAIDLGIALLILLRPGKWTFVLAAAWTCVPRVIAAMSGVENEILESLAVIILAILSYLAHRKGHRLSDLWKS